MRVEILGVDDGAVDVGEHAEFVGATDIVAVAGGAEGDDFFTVEFADQLGLEGLDHAVLFGHATYPFIGFDAHRVLLNM